MDTVLFNSKYGRVRYYISMLVGCCGVAVISEVHFYNITDKKKLYTAFNNHLHTKRIPFNINRCKLLMSDAVPVFPGEASIYDFCTMMKWHGGPSCFNAKSGNNVVLFESNRKVL